MKWILGEERCCFNVCLFVSHYLNLFYLAISYFLQVMSVFPAMIIDKQSLSLCCPTTFLILILTFSPHPAEKRECMSTWVGIWLLARLIHHSGQGV